MEPLTIDEKALLTDLFTEDVAAVFEEDPDLYAEIQDAFDAASPDPWYGVPLWLLKWLLKHLPKK